jgi:PrgI family protein
VSARVRLPADVELEDRLAFGLTFRQLAILGAAALMGYGIFVSVSALAPLPLAAAAAAPFALAGTLLALGRRDGLSADRLALLAARHLARPRRQVLAPEGIPAPLPGTPPRPALAPLELPVRSVLRSGLVELADGRFCLLLRASSASFALRSEEEQAALVEAFGRFLNSAADPLEVVIASEPVDLEARAEALQRAALELPNAALRRAALGHSRFLASLGSGDEVRRREILLVLSITRARDRAAARTALERRAAEAIELLRGAGVELRALGGEEAARRLARLLDPPGPPPGSQLTGVVQAC